MFASIDLARRIERAEARLTSAIVRAVPDGEPLVLELGGGVAAMARPGSPVNKVIGLGFEDLDDGELDEVEALWLEHGEPVRIELSTLADPSLGSRLTARGYRLEGFESALALDISQRLAGRPPSLPPGVTVTTVDDDTAATWATIVVDGFASPDGTGAVADDLVRPVIEQVMADFGRTPGMRRTVALLDGVPAGAASCRFDDGLAQLCGAATVPEARRRGVQRALLEHRLADARDHGCSLAVITTAPGSQSQANAQRGGFALLYARAILVRTWPDDAA